MEKAVREDLEKAPNMRERTGVQVNSKCNDLHRLRLAALKKTERRPGRLEHRKESDGVGDGGGHGVLRVLWEMTSNSHLNLVEHGAFAGLEGR